MTAPRVTVLLPVHDDETHIAAAVRSILDQRGCDLELVVIDDASTDRTPEVLAGIHDPRLRVVRNPVNLHRSRSLNQAIESVATEYIARMDADDVSLPGRLAAQVALMDASPAIGICGTWIRTIGAVHGATWTLPTEPDEVDARLLFRSVLAHPTVMMRTAAIREHGLRYREDQVYSEDWDLWQRASACFPLANVGAVHLEYRTRPPADLSAGGGDASRRAELLDIIDGCLRRYGIDPDGEQLELHRRIGFHDFVHTEAFVDDAEQWLQTLLAVNRRTERFAEPTFSAIVAEHWFYVCHALAGDGWRALNRFRASPLAPLGRQDARRWAKFLARATIRRPL